MENIVKRIDETKLCSFFTMEGEEKKFPLLLVGSTLCYKTAINSQENYVVIETIKKENGINKNKIFKASICPIISYNKEEIEYGPISKIKEIILDLKVGWTFIDSKYQYGRFEFDIIKNITPKYEYIDLVNMGFKVVDDCIITKIPNLQVGNAFLYISEDLENLETAKIYAIVDIKENVISISRARKAVLKNSLMYDDYKKIHIQNFTSFVDLKIYGKGGKFMSLKTSNENEHNHEHENIKKSSCLIS